MTETVEQRQTQRATRLAALQILYGQQFHGQTIQQVDPLLEEADQGYSSGSDFDDDFDTDFDDDTATATPSLTKSVTKSVTPSVTTKMVTKSDRVFLSRLLSSARTNRRPLQEWLATRSSRRSWQNVDLLLQLILWLATAEMLLERVGGRGSLLGKIGQAIDFTAIDFSSASSSKDSAKDSAKDSTKLASVASADVAADKTDKPDKTDKKLRRKLGILAGEYCGIASLFYDEQGTIGFVNGILDGAAGCDLATIVEDWFIAEQQTKLRLATEARELALARTKDRDDKLANELRIKNLNAMNEVRVQAESKIGNAMTNIPELSYSYSADSKSSDGSGYGLPDSARRDRRRDDEEY